MFKIRYITPLALLLAVFSSSTVAAAEAQSDLFDKSLDELTKVKITSVSKVSEESFRSPASVFVITSEEIQRSGATSIPELLRQVPGVDVAEISANKWAISARGFTDQLSNKLLVLIDGRSVYTPHFSGVYWDVQDTILDDIERIEVIRGPGAALWGANAVNGVINIITKHTKDTQGTYISSGVGNNVQNITEGRYGGSIGDSISYRSYAKFLKVDDTEQANGASANDGWFMNRSGFRVDVQKSPSDSITVQGDIYEGNENKGRIATYPTLTAPYSQSIQDAEGGDVGGGNITTTWNKNLDKDSDLQVKFYYDNARRDYIVQSVLVQTFDFDFQHSFKPNDINQIVWGGGSRYNMERSDGSVYFNYQNDHKYYNIQNIFLQDKISLLPDTLFLTLGSKFEVNTFTGFEYEPSAKLEWSVDDKQTIWSAVSRAVRMPSRSEEDIDLVVGSRKAVPSGYYVWHGNDDLESEEVVAYEIGYRIRPQNNLLFDITGFFNDYKNLRTAERGAIFPTTTTAMSFPLQNKGYGESYGIETSANYDVAKNWRLTAGYTFFTLDLHLDAGSTDTSLQTMEGNSPKNRFTFASRYNIGKHFQFDNTLYYVDNLSTRRIPGYTRFDTRIAWLTSDNMEISLIGQNLFDESHPEFTGALFSSATEVGRSVFGKVAWRY